MFILAYIPTVNHTIFCIPFDAEFTTVMQLIYDLALKDLSTTGKFYCLRTEELVQGAERSIP
jgi:hypothetical protein